MITAGALDAALWALARRQHGVVARRQLLALGFHRQAIEHRIATGRLHPVRRGVYAVGRPTLTRYGHWVAAALRCGLHAVLSHRSAAALWEIAPSGSRIDVSVPARRRASGPGLVVHRRAGIAEGERMRHRGIPVTTPVLTLIDLATCLPVSELEAAVNEADKHDLVDPETLRSALEGFKGHPGARALRRTLDRRTFTLTDSELERRFLPLARRAGLPKPDTRQYVNGFRVDFYWPDLGLVVETDGLRYHRTTAQQARDRLRDQAHSAAGLTPLRFTRARVVFDPRRVQATLTAVAGHLRGQSLTR